MGVRGLAWRAACVAAALWLPVTEGSASVVAEPIARLTLEGGYDSNVLYDGRGDRMGRVSPELGVVAKDHLWSLEAAYGGDFFMYQRSAGGVWNHRGRLKFEDEPDRRLKLSADLAGSYAIDPIGLAQLGIFLPTPAQALIVKGNAKATWRASAGADASLTYGSRLAHFTDGTTLSMQAPGFEVMRRLGPRSSLGGGYQFDIFQSTTAPSLALAHEVKGIYRYAVDRDIDIDLEAGPAFWKEAGGTTLLPEASATLVTAGRSSAFRLTVKHGVSLGNLPTPGVSDGFEVGGLALLGTSFKVAGTGGLWRSGAPPFGSNAVVGYSAEGEIAWLAGSGIELGLGASRFARLDDPSPLLRRTIVGLRLTWEHKPR